MDFQFDVIFIDSFMDNVTYVREVEVCVYSMTKYDEIFLVLITVRG
jgi:hypothetical protein